MTAGSGRDERAALTAAVALSPSQRSRRLFCGAVLVLSLLYLGGFINRGWIPPDEGMFGLSAESALHGQLPHKDFADPYTGGLSWLHALAFRLLGIRLLTLRWVLLFFSLPFVVAFFSAASRFAPPLPAGVVTLLAVVWSIPNGPSPHPSWYNLFLATFGILFLFKYLETNQRRWLFAAGLCAGVSILMKIVGLYDVAAVLLFLGYREQVLSAASAEGRPSRVFFLVKAAACAVFIGLLVHLFRSGLDLMDVVHFFVPTVAVWTVLLVFERREGRGAVPQRFWTLSRLLVPFGIGVALPIALFLLPYVRSGSLGDLYRGLFVLSQVQIGKARLTFPPLATLEASVPYSALLAFPFLIPRRWQRWIVVPLVLLLAVGVLAAKSDRVYEWIWNSARSLDIAAAVAGCLFLIFRGSELPAIRRQQLFLLVSVCALLTLVQFPFAAPVYFCLIAPLVALTIFAVVSLDSRSPKWVHACVLGFYLVFGMIRLNSSYAVIFLDYRADGVLALPRGGLRIPAGEASMYESLVGVIEKRGRGRPLYAAPDCSEVYFLSAQPNPTRFFFDFHGGLSGNWEALERVLDEKQVAIVVVNLFPEFSQRLTPETLQGLRIRYPYSLRLGKFLVMWKD